MTSYFGAIAAVLLATLALGLVRVWRGPTPGDRILSILLSGTTGVGLLLVLAAGGNIAALDTALVLTVLAPVTATAFVAARRPPIAGATDDR